MTAPTCGELSCDECNARTAALTAERDQLRQQVANLTYSNNAHRETAETWRAAAIERDQLRADCEAEAERYRLVTLRLETELAAERARLDWLESPAGMHWQWQAGITRATIDAKMQEGAK